jgi:hypothetical protein
VSSYLYAKGLVDISKNRKQSWFQFNDEVVTRIKTLGDKKSAKEVPNVANNGNPPR